MPPSEPIPDETRFDRLRRTGTFRGGRFSTWREAILGVVGAGILGLRLAVEAVLSGAAVRIWDFDVGRRENRGTQLVRDGVPKVESAVAACDAICGGRAVGYRYDIRHAGVGELAQLTMIVDCSDDPALALPLTRLSNGLGIPLLRLAVDGSGASETGRVLCSHGGAAGHACQICPYDLGELLRPTRRTPCPGQPGSERAPTIAGGALGAAIAGCGLLQAQRLVTGNDLNRVVDREIRVDLSRWQVLPIERRRSGTCLSGHVRWQLTRMGRSADQLTLADVFAEAERRLGGGGVTLEPYGHPLFVEATCDCGARLEAVGTRWATPPRCAQCGGMGRWFNQTPYARLRKAHIDELGIRKAFLPELGLPSAGAMFVARTAGKRPLRLLLD